MVRRLKEARKQRREMQLDTKEAFTRIYRQNLWGDGKAPAGEPSFYSGPGSDESVARPYTDRVKTFITEHNIRTVVDLGCGDFRVGRLIANPSILYTGVDIVEPLIASNAARFANDHIAFRCLDIARDEPPDADLCLVREVLQHLSNGQILAILAKLKRYKWVIVTEQQPGPPGTFRPNRDKPYGQASRVVWNSGIVLDMPPFNVARVTRILDVPVPESVYTANGRLSSFLIENTPA
jgi:SAM-dependent methyltransferase